MRLLAALLPALVLGAQTAPKAAPPAAAISPEQAAQFWQRLGARERFLDSAEAHAEPQSLYRFFTREEYGRLQGNPALGYLAAGRFHWTGPRIAWLRIKPVTPDAAPVTARAWDEAFRFLAKRHHWILDPKAPLRLSGACVGAVLEPTPGQPYVGVCIEIRLASPTGTLLYRFSVAKPAIEDAVGAALDWVLCCAMNLPPASPGKETHHGAAQP